METEKQRWERQERERIDSNERAERERLADREAAEKRRTAENEAYERALEERRQGEREEDRARRARGE